ncbi:RING-H2 finger protein ATL32-like [Miscanthus floridulus]|uniref:RING-H2 finger protein ATL32-like n=1 Tax=Miscanthus floridulus TaxID=154761 RepID=UPI003457B51A
MRRASMPSVHRSSLLAAGRTAPDEADIRLCSLLLASFVSLMLLCGVLSLLYRASSDSAFPTKIYVILGPTAIMLVLIFLGGLVSCGFQALAASAPPQAPAPARLARRLCACGLSDAAGVATLPSFPFQPAPAQQPAAASEGERQPPRGSAVLCAVCLEDVRAGEMVRQLPACRHLFHVDCVDVWLRSHRTCPLCRCELPRRKATVQQTVAVTPATPEAVPLPPV